MVSPENIHISNIIKTEQIIFMYLQSLSLPLSSFPPPSLPFPCSGALGNKYYCWETNLLIKAAKAFYVLLLWRTAVLLCSALFISQSSGAELFCTTQIIYACIQCNSMRSYHFPSKFHIVNVFYQLFFNNKKKNKWTFSH